MAHGNLVMLTGPILIEREDMLTVAGLPVRAISGAVECGPDDMAAKVVVVGAAAEKLKVYAWALKAAGSHDDGLVVTVQGKALAQRDGSGNYIRCDWIFFHAPPEVQQRAEEQLAPGRPSRRGTGPLGPYRGR
jgi:hypothetical protein